MSIPPALFHAADDRFQPTPLTGGPWRSDAQHGGPPSALLAHLVEQSVPDDRVVARLAVDLLKPVPLTELRGTTERTKVSGRVDRVTATLIHDPGERASETVVATARALLVATGELPEPGWRPSDPPSVVPPEEFTTEAPVWASGETQLTYHRDAVEFRFVRGRFNQPSDADVWVRMLQPLIAGVTVSPLERVMALVDFGSGVSSVFGPRDRVGMINADLNVALHRPMVGEWLRLQSVTRVGDQGIGLCTSTLSDEDGPMGTATQSLLAYNVPG